MSKLSKVITFLLIFKWIIINFQCCVTSLLQLIAARRRIHSAISISLWSVSYSRKSPSLFELRGALAPLTCLQCNSNNFSALAKSKSSGASFLRVSITKRVTSGPTCSTTSRRPSDLLSQRSHAALCRSPARAYGCHYIAHGGPWWSLHRGWRRELVADGEPHERDRRQWQLQAVRKRWRMPTRHPPCFVSPPRLCHRPWHHQQTDKATVRHAHRLPCPPPHPRRSQHGPKRSTTIPVCTP